MKRFELAIVVALVAVCVVFFSRTGGEEVEGPATSSPTPKAATASPAASPSPVVIAASPRASSTPNLDIVIPEDVRPVEVRKMRVMPELKVAKILEITGEQLWTSRASDGGNWYRGFPQAQIHDGERLKTGLKTDGSVELVAGGVVKVGLSSEVEFRSGEVVLDQGVLWAKIDKQKERLRFLTALGVVGVEGTEFFLDTRANQLLVACVEGSVSVELKNGGVEAMSAGDFLEFDGSKVSRKSAPTNAGSSFRKSLRSWMAGAFVHGL